MMLIESPLPGPPEGLPFSASVHLYKAVGRKLLFLDPFLSRESEVQNAQEPGSCLRYSVWSRSLDLSFLRGRNQERMTCCVERGARVWPRMGSSQCALGVFYSHDSWKRHSAALENYKPRFFGFGGWKGGKESKIHFYLDEEKPKVSALPKSRFGT